MNTLLKKTQLLIQKLEELEMFKAEYHKQLFMKEGIISNLRREINLQGSVLDLDKIHLAESLLEIRGYFGEGEGEKISVVDDAIKQLATNIAIRPVYSDLWETFFGTKNLRSYRSQRCDCKYGFGPRHGSINFSVGLKSSVRSRKPQTLSDEEREACIYYLTKLESIEKANQQAVR